MKIRNAIILGFAILVLAAGCSCSEKNGGGDGTTDGSDAPGDTWPDNWPDTWPDWLEIPDNMEGCDPSIRWCDGNARYWCEDDNIHFEECAEGEYCEFGECLPAACDPGEKRCTGDGQIMTCNEEGSGFGDPVACPEGQICEDGACADIVCEPDAHHCIDINTEERCNELGTAWEEIPCSPSYVCDVDECRLQICPPGLLQCVTDTSYHECNMFGTEYGAPVDCPPDTSCYEGACLSMCEIADLTRSSVGCRFYAVDQHNRYDTAPYYIVAANTNDAHTANVILENRRGGVWTTVGTAAVAPNSLTTFTPNASSQVSTTTAFGQGYAFRLTSDIPIVAYQLNAIASCTGEGSMLIPYNGLDQSYYLVTYRGYSGPSLFTIVGADDATTVQITPNFNTTGGGTIPAITAGTTASITVSECDVAQIVAADVHSDLTGTRVESDKPIAIFTGTYCSHMPGGADATSYCTWCHVTDCTSCDPLEEQLNPKTTWGRLYIAAIVPEFNWGYFKVIAEQDSTTVSFTYGADTTGLFPTGTDLPTLTLNALQNSEFELGCTTGGGGCGIALVSADKPIMLMNYIEGGSCRTNGRFGCGGKDHCPGEYADPSMIIVPPTEQFMREYIFLTPAGFTNNYVTVFRETGSTVTLDAAAVATAFLPVPGSVFEVGHVPVGEGTHHIESTLPFGIILEGYGYANSYGYPGGMKLENINP
jgi:hypothetical protein